MPHVINVDISSLQAVAARIAQSAAELPSGAAGPDSDAGAGPAAVALRGTAAEWTAYLAALSAAVAATGADLRDVAGIYAGAERAARDLCRGSRWEF